MRWIIAAALAAVALAGMRWIYRELLRGGFPTNAGEGPYRRPYIRPFIRWEQDKDRR